MGQHKIKQEKRLLRKETAAPPQRMNQHLYDQAVGSMTPEQLEAYEKMGDEMYNNVDFITSEPLNNTIDPISESIAYITEALTSGLHPTCLDDDEKRVMVEGYGKKWYAKWCDDYPEEEEEEDNTIFADDKITTIIKEAISEH